MLKEAQVKPSKRLLRRMEIHGEKMMYFIRNAIDLREEGAVPDQKVFEKNVRKRIREMGRTSANAAISSLVFARLFPGVLHLPPEDIGFGIAVTGMFGALGTYNAYKAAKEIRNSQVLRKLAKADMSEEELKRLVHLVDEHRKAVKVAAWHLNSLLQDLKRKKKEEKKQAKIKRRAK